MTFIGTSSRAGDLAQQLRGHTALTEDMSLGPSIDDQWLLTTCNHSSKGSHTFFWPPYCTHVRKPTLRYTHIYIIKVFFKKNIPSSKKEHLQKPRALVSCNAEIMQYSQSQNKSISVQPHPGSTKLSKKARKRNKTHSRGEKLPGNRTVLMGSY